MKKMLGMAWAASLIVIVGCSQKAADRTAADSSPSPASVDGRRFLLTAEPEGGLNVIQARESAKDQDDVVVVGRIGGSEDPWIAGRAAFTIVDPSLKSCDQIGSDNCPKPWDFC